VACEYGSPPDLMDENLDAWDLWIEVKTQWRGSGAGLDYNIVYAEAERLGIDLSVCTMKKIKALEAKTLGGQEVGKQKAS